MLPEYFVFISALLASLGGLQYLYLTIRGKVQPNKMSYFFWGVLPCMGFLAQYEQGGGSVIWVTFVIALIPFIILIAATFNPLAYWGITKLDYALGAITVLSIIIWKATDSPEFALVFAIVADFFATIPTIIKSYTHPFSEDWRPYMLNTVGFLIGILAIQKWTFENYSFIVYVFSVTLCIAVTIYIRQMMLK
jgi:hypothetical protein